MVRLTALEALVKRAAPVRETTTLEPEPQVGGRGSRLHLYPLPPKHLILRPKEGDREASERGSSGQKRAVISGRRWRLMETGLPYLPKKVRSTCRFHEASFDVTIEAGDSGRSRPVGGGKETQPCVL